MLRCHRLPLDFDAELLKANLREVLPTEWVPHFNRGYYEGEWKGTALRSTTGRTTQMHRHPDDTGVAVDTAITVRCSYFRRVLDAFNAPIRLARLLSLGPGASIREHVDYFLGLEDGMIRIHVPITTDPRVEFFVDNKRLVMEEGEAWYIDFSLPHRVHNLSDQHRVHLVIDCDVNEWVQSIIPFNGVSVCEPQGVSR